MHRVIHFEIHAAEPEELLAFYKNLFGWQAQRWGENPYWLLTTGSDTSPGINGALLKRHGASPASGAAVNAFVCTVQTPNLDETVSKALQMGATLALPKQAVPGIGWLAYIKDPDENILGLMQDDTTAK